jgi:hypothetical protein
MNRQPFRRNITFTEFAVSFGLFALGTLAVTVFVALVPIF